MRYIVLATFALFAGCVHRLSSDMDAWKGRTADDLIATWGAPNRTADLSDGRKVLTWVRRWNSAQDGEQPVMVDCERSFTIASGRVTSWSAHGCPSVYLRQPEP